MSTLDIFYPSRTCSKQRIQRINLYFLRSLVQSLSVFGCAASKTEYGEQKHLKLNIDLLYTSILVKQLHDFKFRDWKNVVISVDTPPLSYGWVTFYMTRSEKEGVKATLRGFTLSQINKIFSLIMTIIHFGSGYVYDS